MKSASVPDADHISRHCPFGQLKEDGTPSGGAFRLREKSGKVEEYLSVNWLEALKKEHRAEEIDEIRTILGKKLKLRSRARIAVINVGELRDHVRRDSPDARMLRVLHKPTFGDYSHSGVHGLELEDDIIADLIAQTVKKIYPAHGE